MKIYLYDKEFKVHTEELNGLEYHYIVKSMEFYDGYDLARLNLEFEYLIVDGKKIIDTNNDYDEQVICYIMVESIIDALEENGYIIDDEYLG